MGTASTVIGTVAPVAITVGAAYFGYEYMLSGKAGPVMQLMAQQIQALMFPPAKVLTSSTTTHNCPMIPGDRYVAKLRKNLFQLVWRGRVQNLYPTQALAEAAYNALCESDYY